MSIRERPYLEEVESYLNAAYKDTSILKYDDNLISLFIFEENYLNTFFFFLIELINLNWKKWRVSAIEPKMHGEQ